MEEHFHGGSQAAVHRQQVGGEAVWHRSAGVQGAEAANMVTFHSKRNGCQLVLLSPKDAEAEVAAGQARMLRDNQDDVGALDVQHYALGGEDSDAEVQVEGSQILLHEMLQLCSPIAVHKRC